MGVVFYLEAAGACYAGKARRLLSIFNCGAVVQSVERRLKVPVLCNFTDSTGLNPCSE